MRRNRRVRVEGPMLYVIYEATGETSFSSIHLHLDPHAWIARLMAPSAASLSASGNVG